MATKKKPKVNITTVKTKIPEGCFVWESRMVSPIGHYCKVFAVIGGDGTLHSVEDEEGNFIALPLWKGANKDNVIYKPETLKELGQRYGFTKKA